MKASELRIGNLVLYKDENETPEFVKIKVDVSDLIIIREKENGGEFLKINYSPIPLSPEILEKCGFEKINHRIGGVIYEKNWLRCSESMSWDWRGGYISNKPQHLHQLQNLYFALTGEELTINF